MLILPYINVLFFSLSKESGLLILGTKVQHMVIIQCDIEALRKNKE